ncbi:uncharacterized protein LOC6738937 [Drosophila simulans]|uniref:GD14925 n=1 Tax=Drosophila simulans TaxID=7240 RepID=B4QJL7_DROSI|nr:uncharacterized protein LOC6738937 [Drosophila simulans]EDX11317.1 GD14925 [Drosophila simulans]KMZ00912.1 uncharacterized protein Dsimw501_GD14925 [Drosophila simulans]
MNVDKARDEMLEMSEQVWKDAEQWQRGIHNGQAIMRQIRAIYLKLFTAENKLNNADSRKGLQSTEKRLNYLYQRLQRPLATIGNILKALTGIRDNTARMLNRLTLFMDDETLAQHRIRPKLESSKLLMMLQFLSHRYDTEWEVKEMVVNDLERISNSYELDLAIQCWSTCSHAGGPEFAKMMREYYQIIDRRQSF